jgi:eukaryotic-like serine/threonine-protein kinase
MSAKEILDRRFLHCPKEPGEGPATMGLPRDLIEKAGRRLGVAALVYAAAYLLAYPAFRTAGQGDLLGMGPFPQAQDFVAVVFIAASIGFFFLARSGLVADRQLLDLGLVYVVVAAGGIDVWLAFGMWPEGTMVTGISWVCVWIVFFPLIVPSTTGKVVIASLAAATTTPVLYAVGQAAGAPPLVNIVPMFTANYICAGIAVVGHRVVFGLGTDLGNALRMGSYQLVEKLGEGGMGEVWKAEHQMLARPAAIKLLSKSAGKASTGGSGPEQQRLEREVQATAQLRSPHTVEVYDYGLTEDGRFYYVMELLDGLDLEQLVARHGPMPAERAIHVLRQACHSLAEAHAHGLVHRDVKPANILLCRYGQDEDFVKVLDFGLVKRTGELARGDTKLTEAGGFAGTPAYGSPESAGGEGEKADPRSDLYSLGCVAHWLLTGRTVFEAASPMLMLVQHLHQDPEAPSKFAELPVPPALDQLVLDCLAKDPAKRPSSAEQVSGRLSAIELDAPWSAERARQWWAQHAT